MSMTTSHRAKWLKTISIFTVLSVTTVGLAACSGKDNGSTGSSATPPGSSSPSPTASATPSGPVEITWMTPLYTQSQPKDTVLKLVEQKTNTKLDITWVPDAVKEDKLNTAIASNTLTKVVTVQDIKNSAFQSAVKSGMFWELGPHLKNYPNLAKMNETILNNTKIDGKIYGIYRERPLTRQGIVVRKDWLDNLGLQAPKNVNELYNVLKAFTLNDPDKNGKNDTFGLTDRNDLKFGAFKTLGSYFGVPNEWGEKDGKLQPEFTFDAYLETAKFMKRLFSEKLMNDDFTVASKNQQWDKFTTGQAGLYVGNMVDAANLYNAGVKVNPNIKLDILNRISGPDGKDRVWSQAGHNGIFVIPKTVVKTEAELKQILGALDKLQDPEVFNLMKLGVENTHYKVVGGNSFENIAAANDAREVEVRPLDSLVGMDRTALKAANDPLREKYEALTLDNNKIVVPNPAEAFDSPTLTQRGTELRKIIDDATFKFISGAIDEAAFKAEVEKWKKSGGDKIIEEINAAYAASKK
ncbi:extracellular solute-binding protein [Paenibacillus koleovorans]|uniref:extracellular solute-binding protein n=1 Tax=Paenibacillus koleovorans TaxID=121608 RepID=UPI001FE6824E|nr:extracellular solute-binding protein [Paenibacillus koleovorans]